MGRRQSDNFERRGSSGKGIALGGIGTVIAIIIAIIMGKNPLQILNEVGQGASTEQTTTTEGGPATEAEQFSRVVFADTEDVWNKIFSEMGQDYKEPILTTFEGNVSSACGSAGSATGPFYCPADQRVYIDLSFYNDLKNRFNAPGDFAMAYVIAHEVGHHIQNLMGTTQLLQEAQGQSNYNDLSVKLELQADFLAGVWAHHNQEMKNVIEEGDIEEALNAANAIGDDKLQKESQGHVVPDAFTHGTSAQRVRWFKKGYETGDIKQGDTFNASVL